MTRTEAKAAPAVRDRARAVYALGRAVAPWPAATLAETLVRRFALGLRDVHGSREGARKAQVKFTMPSGRI